MQFATYLKESKAKIDEELTSLLNHWSNYLLHTTPQLAHLNSLFIKSFYGGKYLRGTLVCLGFEITDSRKTQEIYKIAAAYEILHTALLIHDDVIDLSPLRRGKPTIHTTLGDNHYGISQAICLGDIGFFLASKIIFESKFQDNLKIKALSFLSQTILNTVLGQMLDIQLPYSSKTKKERDVIIIQVLKTADYTITTPLSLGAILGGAEKSILERIAVFGKNLGIAFQIQDDILGVFGDEKELGKSVTSDIEEGKNTLLITYALQKSTPSQKKLLNQLYGKGNLSFEEFEMVKQIFLETGSLEYSKKKALKYTEDAKRAVPFITQDKRIQTILNDLADMLVSRQK